MPAEAQKRMSPLTKFAIEVGPLAVFFIVNSKAEDIFGNAPADSIFYATGAFMVAITASLIANFILERRLPTMPLVTAVFVLVLGGLTLYLQDELFIKLKPTFTNLLFAGILVGGLAFGKLFLRYVFGAAFRLSEHGWRILTWRWAAFFVVLAIANEIVWRNFSTDFWVSFKVFGIAPLTFVFALAQLTVVRRHGSFTHDEGEETDEDGRRHRPAAE